MFNVGFLAFLPQSNTGPISGSATANVNTGDTILQVFDLVTGDDRTSSFDSFCDTQVIFQTDNTPNTSHCHLALLHRVGTPDHNFVITVATSLGSAAGSNGAMTANGVAVGDEIVEAVYPTMANTSFNPQFPYGNFAPSVATANTIHQLHGSGNAHPTLFLLEKAGYETPEIGLDLCNQPPNSPQYLTLNNTLAGAKIQQVLDLTVGDDVTGQYAPYVGSDTQLKRLSGSLNNNMTMFISSPVGV